MLIVNKSPALVRSVKNKLQYLWDYKSEPTIFLNLVLGGGVVLVFQLESVKGL